MSTRMAEQSYRDFYLFFGGWICQWIDRTNKPQQIRQSSRFHPFVFFVFFYFSFIMSMFSPREQIELVLKFYKYQINRFATDSIWKIERRKFSLWRFSFCISVLKNSKKNNNKNNWTSHRSNYWERSVLIAQSETSIHTWSRRILKKIHIVVR